MVSYHLHWEMLIIVYPLFKTCHYIISFVWPLHSKPGMETYCWSSTDQLSWYQVWPSCWLWGNLIMVRCVLSQLKPLELHILSCGKAKNLEFLGLYPIPTCFIRWVVSLYIHVERGRWSQIVQEWTPGGQSGYRYLVVPLLVSGALQLICFR